MASLHPFPQRKCFRVRFTVTLGPRKKQKSRYPRSLSVGRSLYNRASQLEEATRDGIARDGEIRAWIEEGLLEETEAACAFVGWHDTVTRQPGELIATNVDALLAAYEQYALSSSKAKDARRKSHANHMSVARQVCRWLTERDLQSLTNDDCRQYQDEMATRFARWTVFHRMTKLRLLLDQAVKLGMLHDNPARGLRLRQPKRETERRILTIEEVKDLLDLSLESRRRGGLLPTAVRLGLYAGLRDEEMRWARWDWLRGRILTVQRAECEGERWEPKDAEARRLDVKQALVDYLEEEKKHREEEATAGPWMISGRSTERPVAVDSLAQAFRRMVRRSGMDPKITLYCLRHTYATELLRVTDLRTVQKRLGHESIRTTQEYLHAMEPEEHPTDQLPY
jgi:integrase